MLHVIHQRIWDFDGSHSGRALQAAGVPFRSFSAFVNMRYRTTAELLLRVYPGLVWNTVRLGFRSLVMARPRPDTILVSTEIEALLLGIMRRLCLSRAKVVLQTLIITPRRSPLQQKLHRAYWWCILRVIDFGTVHSRSEVALYRGYFPRFADRFVFIPYGMSVDYHGPRDVPGPADLPVVVTAGRSGRDYPTLVRAVQGLPCRLVIICDRAETLAGVEPSDQVTILSKCFDDDYLRTLASASFVVVPLSVDEISAGQMVYLQAAALSRAVIMTATSTSVDYADDGEQAIFVRKGDAASLRDAMTRLLDDPALVARLGAAAQARFQTFNSTEANVRQLLSVIAGREAPTLATRNDLH